MTEMGAACGGKLPAWLPPQSSHAQMSAAFVYSVQWLTAFTCSTCSIWNAMEASDQVRSDEHSIQVVRAGV